MIQLQVLNKVLKDKDISIITRNNLDADFFSDYKLEFTFIMNHYNTYHSVPDYESVLSRFPDFKVINVSEGNSYLLEELYKDKNTRDLAYAFNNVRNLVMQNKTDEAMTLFKNFSEKITSNKSLEAVNLVTDTSRYDTYVDKITNFNKYYIRTGLKELDDLITGWDKFEELAAIVAKSGVGKSWLLTFFMAQSAMQGLNVGLYSGEMSAEKVGYRFDTMVGHISNGSLVYGKENVKLEYKDYIDHIREKVPGNVYVITPYTINGAPTVSALRAFVEKYNLDILYVDQHSLLEDEKNAKVAFEKAANISKDLKMLQSLKKLPIIAVSQLNRTGNDEDTGVVTLDQISNSSRIGQDCTIVLAVSRDKKDQNIFKIQIVKTRYTNETNKVLTYYADFNVGKLRFIPEEALTDGDSEDYEHRYDMPQQTPPNGEEVFNWN